MPDRTSVKVALDMFVLEKFNCAESVLAGLAREFGLDCPCVPGIATAFGGGMAAQGDVCGAITGAMMALGLKFGRNQGDDNESKAVTYGKVRELFQAFEKEFGTCKCFDLIGIDLTTPEGLEESRRVDLHANVCHKYVRFATETAAGLM